MKLKEIKQLLHIAGEWKTTFLPQKCLILRINLSTLLDNIGLKILEVRMVAIQFCVHYSLQSIHKKYKNCGN